MSRVKAGGGVSAARGPWIARVSVDHPDEPTAALTLDMRSFAELAETASDAARRSADHAAQASKAATLARAAEARVLGNQETTGISHADVALATRTVSEDVATAAAEAEASAVAAEDTAALVSLAVEDLGAGRGRGP